MNKEIEAQRWNKKLEEFLISQGYPESYPKKNIRIYFKCTKGKISRLDVVEFNPEWFDTDPQRAEKINNFYRTGFDIGNASSTWHLWTPVSIMYHLFAEYGFEDKETEIRSLFELTRIKEMRLDVAHLLYTYHLLNLPELS